MGKIRLGVIGCGNMCRHHLASVGGKSASISDELRPFAEQVEIRGLADIDLLKAEAHRKAYGGEYVTDDTDILPTFVRSILKDETPPATAVDGARTTRFILKCFESARTGKVIKFV